MSLTLNITRSGQKLFNEASHYPANSILVLQNSDKIYLLTSTFSMGLTYHGLFLVRLDDKSALPTPIRDYNGMLFREVKSTLTVEL